MLKSHARRPSEDLAYIRVNSSLTSVPNRPDAPVCHGPDDTRLQQRAMAIWPERFPSDLSQFAGPGSPISPKRPSS
jgi:hypothetical protein